MIVCRGYILFNWFDKYKIVDRKLIRFINYNNDLVYNRFFRWWVVWVIVCMFYFVGDLLIFLEFNYMVFWIIVIIVGVLSKFSNIFS